MPLIGHGRGRCEAVGVDSRRQVLQDRAAALAAGDASRLGRLLHENFGWTAHTGESFDRAACLESNTVVARAGEARILVTPR